MRLVTEAEVELANNGHDGPGGILRQMELDAERVKLLKVFRSIMHDDKPKNSGDKRGIVKWTQSNCWVSTEKQTASQKWQIVDEDG